MHSTEWRRQQRAELIARRMALPPELLAQWNAAIGASIAAGFALLARMTVGFCWPHKNEFDARAVIGQLRDRGATAALPVVVSKASPLQFRKWWPGAPMSLGVYEIPIPDGTELVTPDAIIMAMNGFDAQGYRLGYGGAYFDRTLAAASPRPLAIGAGFELGRLPTLQPQAHDIAMDFIVTESGLHAVVDSKLTPIDPDQCRARAQRLCEQRGLPRPRRIDSAGLSSPVCYASEFPGYFGETDEDQMI